MIVLYDLSASVPVSAEDAEVFAMVNRGRRDALAGRVVVRRGDRVRIEKRTPLRMEQALRWVLRALIVSAAGAAVCFAVAVAFLALALPTKVSPLLTILVWSAMLAALIFSGRKNQRR